jgi:hypothetical protein
LKELGKRGIIICNQPGAAPLALASSFHSWRPCGRCKPPRPPPRHCLHHPQQLHIRVPHRVRMQSKRWGNRQKGFCLCVTIATSGRPSCRPPSHAAGRAAAVHHSIRLEGLRRWLSAVAASERRRQRTRGKMANTSSMHSKATSTPPLPSIIPIVGDLVGDQIRFDSIFFSDWKMMVCLCWANYLTRKKVLAQVEAQV